jgi:uncharacterized membrane protein HdeD (DUF308 family)
MKPFENFFRSERFEMDWRRSVAQGVVIMLMGIGLVLVCLVRPNVIILSARELSWLPASGMVILALGLVECLDAFLAKETRDFLQNLQVGVLDAVIGALIVLSVAEEPARFSMMIVNYLIARGVVRVTIIHALQLPRAGLSSIGGFLSIIMGFMIWMGWPSTAGWFLSLCLNVEIAVRGWAIIIFALWVKKQNDNELLRVR